MEPGHEPRALERRARARMHRKEDRLGQRGNPVQDPGERRRVVGVLGAVDGEEEILAGDEAVAARRVRAGAGPGEMALEGIPHDVAG